MVTHTGGGARRRRAIGAQLDAAPHGIFAAKMHRGEPLVDDRRVVACGAVAAVEQSPAREPHANGFEIPRSYRDQGDGRRLLSGRFGTSFDGQLSGRTAADRDARRERCTP